MKKGDLRTTQTKEGSTCPTCQHGADGSLSLEGAVPSEGHIVVCAYCSVINVYGKDLIILTMSDEEKEDVKITEPEVWKKVLFAQSVVVQLIRESKTNSNIRDVN